jgi:uncharacterized protein YndB with AHSA1/START domain
MIDFTIETHIARPVADVFAYATDPAKLATWQTNTVSAAPEGDGPLGVGTRLHEVHRGPGGKEMPSVVEVSEYVPDSRFGLRMVEGALPIHADLAFAPNHAGTVFRFRVFGAPTGAMKLLQPVLRRALRKQFAEHCANLKRVLEEGAPSSGA